MFLSRLIIASETKIIRDVSFRKGINLIIDETAAGNKKSTGNSVGKTTVLILIDFCLGGKPNNIWLDPESKKSEYLPVKNFLKDNKVLIKLILKENLNDEKSREVVIERNFLSKKELIRRINGENYTEDEFEMTLSKLLFPTKKTDKPTFRQVISHNIRYKEEAVGNTLRTLDKFSSDVEYETLHLFMLNVDYDLGSQKQILLQKLKEEESFKSRLERSQPKNAYESALSIIEEDIEELNRKKLTFNINEAFEADLDNLNSVKYQINRLSGEISALKMRQDLIQQAVEELKANRVDIDLNELKLIYEQATSFVETIQKTFEDLVAYHNTMVGEKLSYITKELPSLNEAVAHKTVLLNNLLEEEKSLTLKVSKSDSFDELEKIISEMNEKFRKRGEYENIIRQLEESESQVQTLNQKLEKIDNELFSEEIEQQIKRQTTKFNKFFASISNELYGEPYALKYEVITNSKGQKLYKFSAFNANMSSGKKQGEISSFDIAYTLFADQERIPCLHFILNDKKELMHDNQLSKIAEIVERENIQFVASILRDKLPPSLNDEKFFILKLSQSDKLFKIEG